MVGNVCLVTESDDLHERRISGTYFVGYIGQDCAVYALRLRESKAFVDYDGLNLSIVAIDGQTIDEGLRGGIKGDCPWKYSCCLV